MQPGSAPLGKGPATALRGLRAPGILLVLPLLLAASCADDRPIPVVYPLPAPYADIDLSYLPFEYLPDGCTQRASYVGMELAVRGVPTVAVDAETCDLHLDLRGPFGEPWRHHAVPAILRDGNVPALLDPLASPDFLTLEDWLRGMIDDPVRVFVASTAYPTSHGHETTCGTTVVEVDPLPATVSDMTPWLLENVMGDCAMLRQAHRDSPVYDPAREQRLVARTKELAQAMQVLGLLDESMNPGLMDQLAKAPWCPEPVPK